MPDWNQSLAQADYGQLKVIAEKWGLQLQAPDERSAREKLVSKLLEGGFLEEKLTQLPDSSTRALAYLEKHGGKLNGLSLSANSGKSGKWVLAVGKGTDQKRILFLQLNSYGTGVNCPRFF